MILCIKLQYHPSYALLIFQLKYLILPETSAVLKAWRTARLEQVSYCVKNANTSTPVARNRSDRNMSGTHRCCLRLLSISRVHTDGDPTLEKWRAGAAIDLLIDRGFDLARGYRFRVVASWRVILSAAHNASAVQPPGISTFIAPPGSSLRPLIEPLRARQSGSNY